MRPRHRHSLPERIGTSIEAAAPEGAGDLRRLIDAWVDIVGPGLATHAMPARRRRDGALVIHAGDASWQQAVELERRRLLTALRERLGEDVATELRVEIGPVGSLPDRGPEPPSEAPPTEPGPRALALTQGVSDQRLRAALATVIEHTAKSGKTRS